MPKVHLIEGPVGAGKSTFATALAARHHGVHVALDEWFARLFSPDRPASDVMPWYAERKKRLIGLIWGHSRRVLASGRDVVLELGLIRRHERLEFVRSVRDEGFDLVIHVLEAPHDVRRDRVRRRNSERGSTFSMVVPDDIFELASRLWEPPDDDECSEFQVELVDSAKAAIERTLY